MSTYGPGTPEWDAFFSGPEWSKEDIDRMREAQPRPRIFNVISPLNTGMRAAKRCSDFDDECIEVVCHYTCWKGGADGPQADGYCPYLIGQMGPKR